MDFKLEMALEQEAKQKGLDPKAYISDMRRQSVETILRELEVVAKDTEARRARGEPIPEDPSEVREALNRRKARESFRDTAGIPERYREASLEGWEPVSPEEGELKRKLQDWSKNIDSPNCPSIALQGSVGTGKTWIACGILNDRLNNWRGGLFVTAKGYTGKIKESYRRDSAESESSILERYAAVRILVLDEVGRQFESESEHLYLFDLINERYNRGHPTVFLSNLTVEQFRAFLGEALVDRIREGGGKIHQLNWKSRRG